MSHRSPSVPSANPPHFRWTAFTAVTLATCLLAQSAFGFLSDMNALGVTSFPARTLPQALHRHVRVPSRPVSASRSVVFILQDVHMNPEAQRQIAASLNILSLWAARRGETLRIGVEGSVGPFNFRPYRPSTVIADRLLEDNRIGAVPYAALTAAQGHPGIRATGIEDPSLYSANVDAFRQAHGQRDDALSQWSRDRTALNSAIQVLPKRARRFLNAQEAHEDGSGPLADYLRFLSAETTDVPLAVEVFLAAQSLETGLDFALAERERKHVLMQLSEKMSAAELNELTAVAEGAARSDGGAAAFYRSLLPLLHAHGIHLRQTPHFDDYIRYVLLADSIDGAALYEELRTLERAVIGGFALTGPERRTLNQARRLQLEKKLIAFSLTPAEWLEYQDLRQSGERDALRPFETFYRVADRRNAALVQNLGSVRVGAIVAGGFHTPGLVAILEASGVEAVVLTPRLTRLDPGEPAGYLSVFLERQGLLEKIFAGRRLFVAVPEGFGTDVSRQKEIPAIRASATRAYRALEAIFLRRPLEFSLLAAMAIAAPFVINPSDGVSPFAANPAFFLSALTGAVAMAVVSAGGFGEDWTPAWRARPERIDVVRLSPATIGSHAYFAYASPVTATAYSPDNRWRADGTHEYDPVRNEWVPVINLIDRSRNVIVATLRGHQSRSDIAVLRFGESALISVGKNGDAILWSLPDGRPITDVQLLSSEGRQVAVVSGAVSRSGKRVLVGDEEGNIHLLELVHQDGLIHIRTLSIRHPWDELRLVDFVSSRPKGPNHEDNLIVVWTQLNEGTLYAVTPDGLVERGNPILMDEEVVARTTAAALHPDGVHIVTGHEDGHMRRINIWTGDVRTWPGNGTPVRTFRFSRDGSMFAVWDNESTITYWAWHSREPIQNLGTAIFRPISRGVAYPMKGIQAFDFSPDGRLAIAGTSQPNASMSSGLLVEAQLPLQSKQGTLFSKFFSMVPFLPRMDIGAPSENAIDFLDLAWTTVVVAAALAIVVGVGRTIRSLRLRNESSAKGPVLVNSVPEATSQGLSMVGELRYVRENGTGPAPARANLVEIPDEAAAHRFKPVSEPGHTTVLVTTIESVKRILEGKISGRSDYGVQLRHDDLIDAAEVLSVAAQADPGLAEALSGRHIDIRIYAATPQWTAGTVISVRGRDVPIEQLSVRVFLGRAIASLLDLVRNVPLHEFFEKLRRAHRAAAEAA